MAPLHIYKASAGSGKTFQLTRTYVEMLFRNPDAYRQILAVTFTNKAASEMKLRILDRLHDLSKAKDENQELIYFHEKLQKDKEEIRKLARDILIRILNGYSWFSVGTIDRFFQGVIRAFTREMGLPAGFALELDHDRMLGEAVDRMFMLLQDDKDLLNWLTSYAEERIGEEKNWNFKDEILGLGKELFSEEYQSILLNRASLPDRELLRTYVTKLNVLLKAAEKEIKSQAQTCRDKLQGAGLIIKDFHNKSNNPVSLFDKILDQGMLSMTDSQVRAITDTSKWYKSDDSDQNKLQLIHNDLIPAYSKIRQEMIMYHSAYAVKSNVFSLGILGDLAEQILEISNEKNIFLLSDASRLLRGLIGNNPTPFIYEKTGARVSNIMLDEFQDTSIFQWENFKPLIEDSLATGNNSLVVGDVKQSIYRWRNGDWKILADKLGKSFPGHMLEAHTLTHNWRSRELLIRSFNTVFAHAPDILVQGITDLLEESNLDESTRTYWQSLLETAYAESYQEIPGNVEGSGGYFKAEILEEEKEKFEDLADAQIPEWIKELQDAGYKAGDIAILVRWNREGARVADILMDEMENAQRAGYNFNFISNESLFLFKNPAITFLVSLLNYFNAPEDKLNRLQLHHYYRLVKPSEKRAKEIELHADPGIEDLLGEDFAREKQQMKRLPLFELLEKLIDVFELHKESKDLPYLQAFQELVLEFQSDTSSGIHEFIVYWKEHGHKKVLKVAEGQDAIRIMTIHKAKGLQFRAVVVPYCNWSLGPTGGGNKINILWCDTEGTDFDELQVVPLKSSSALKDTVFAKPYVEEQIMTRVDALNLLYVGLTRAQEALIAGIPPQAKKGDVKNAGQLLWKSITEPSLSGKEGTIDFEEHRSDRDVEIGVLKSDQLPSESDEADWTITNYPIHISNDRLRLRLKSSSYLDPEGEEKVTRNFGNMMHEIFSKIIHLEDIQSVMMTYRRDGTLKEKEYQKLLEYTTRKMETPGVNAWFEPDLKIMNERSIISEGEVYRPDRVVIRDTEAQVIDYKFGKAEHGYYRKQVDEYCRLISEMGYTNVSGFLWYVELDKIEKVL